MKPAEVSGIHPLNITVTVAAFINKLQALLNVKPDLLFLECQESKCPRLFYIFLASQCSRLQANCFIQ